MKSDLQKGALYLIDNEFRERYRATWASSPSSMATGMEMRVTPPEMEMEYGTKYVTNWKPYQNGIVFLADIENHGNKNLKYDICKVCFNNSSGVRYLYRDVLELAKKVDRIKTV